MPTLVMRNKMSTFCSCSGIAGSTMRTTAGVEEKLQEAVVIEIEERELMQDMMIKGKKTGHF